MKTRLVLHIVVALLSLPFFGCSFVILARWAMFGSGEGYWVGRALAGVLCGMIISVLHLILGVIYDAVEYR